MLAICQGRLTTTSLKPTGGYKWGTAPELHGSQPCPRQETRRSRAIRSAAWQRLRPYRCLISDYLKYHYEHCIWSRFVNAQEWCVYCCSHFDSQYLANQSQTGSFLKLRKKQNSLTLDDIAYRTCHRSVVWLKNCNWMRLQGFALSKLQSWLGNTCGSPGTEAPERRVYKDAFTTVTRT